MTRSVWKGPFVDGYLLKKAEVAQKSARRDVIKIWSRRSTILPQFVGITFGVYNGNKHIPVTVTEETSLADAAQTLHQMKFGALPVIRDGRLVGILTDNDLIRCLAELLEQGG